MNNNRSRMIGAFSNKLFAVNFNFFDAMRAYYKNTLQKGKQTFVRLNKKNLYGRPHHRKSEKAINNSFRLKLPDHNL